MSVSTPQVDPELVAEANAELRRQRGGLGVDYELRVRRSLEAGELGFVDASAIAGLASTSVGVVHQWRRRHASFPAPIVVLAIGPVWLRDEVAAWLATPRANGRPPAVRS
jgi:hypothetical protein